MIDGVCIHCILQPIGMAEQNISMNFQYGTESLNYYFRQGKVTQEEFSVVQQAMKNLYNVINNSVKNYNNLHNASKQLKREVAASKYELETATGRQSEASEATQRLSRLLKTAEVAYESQKTAYDNLVFQQDELQKQIQRKEQDIKNEATKAQEDMQPIRQRYEGEIEETKSSNEKTKVQSENIQRLLEQNMLKITAIRAENEASEVEEKKLHQQKLKIVDSPQHYLKSAENLHIQIMGMEGELKDMKEEIERKEKACKNSDQKRQKQVQLYEQLQRQRLEDLQKCRVLQTQIDRLKNQNLRIGNHKQEQKLQMADIQKEQQSLMFKKKALEENISKSRKMADISKKEYKKLEVVKKQHQDQILENEIIIDKLKKEQAEIHFEMRLQKGKAENLSEDVLGIQNRTMDMKDKVLNSEAYRKSIESEISKKEKTLGELKKSVQATQKQVNNLTEMRESMARKASSAMSQVRSTKQQLKVKELLILDLTKKYQQTENKLEHFKALYEEVKSFRNKYVNLIQNSSQDLAELKERIKILQNQLQILKNESSEKNKTIQYYNHMLQLEKHKRDQMKAKLNKCEFEKKEKLELVDQNINQIQKLNMIILSLNKDVQRLKTNFDDVLENRNYTGIQLIDRNDELCILYEKENMQEKILRKGEIAIKALEDEIRMITIERDQTNRKIKVARDKILVIPKLAQKVLMLQKELESEKQREQELSRQLENPNNEKRWRELQGEDPDEQALDAKISVLEERLNIKKEQLLEKELVLDQVSHLANKLKKQAQQNRQSTLQVSEKINEFQSRLKDITRQMKAIISQLAVCQANAIRYTEQRQRLSITIESARTRMEEGYPPTPETEIEYLKMIRDKKRYEQERQIRMQREMVEQSYPPFATKTTAEHRVNAYIPDEIGLPKPYGQHTPFKPTELGSNMRHFKKPKVREIEI